ncbi:hypothetical protein Ahy_A03g011519 [Arachis hypogaea]|uniref:Uncharacterized protein n=1 Tax=Arachis hypogaea TaxID=3818 RepID=A0A445DQY3_ARAHY|nr:hypothetical protein Ahy_A03g011519 [Arachis hypogaea]
MASEATSGFQLIETIREAIRQFPSKKRASREREFDAANFHTVIQCATKSAIEAHFQHVYTHEKFKLNSEVK